MAYFQGASQIQNSSTAFSILQVDSKDVISASEDGIMQFRVSGNMRNVVSLKVLDLTFTNNLVPIQKPKSITIGIEECLYTHGDRFYTKTLNDENKYRVVNRPWFRASNEDIQTRLKLLADNPDPLFEAKGAKNTLLNFNPTKYPSISIPQTNTMYSPYEDQTSPHDLKWDRKDRQYLISPQEMAFFSIDTFTFSNLNISSPDALDELGTELSTEMQRRMRLYNDWPLMESKHIYGGYNTHMASPTNLPQNALLVFANGFTYSFPATQSFQDTRSPQYYSGYPQAPRAYQGTATDEYYPPYFEVLPESKKLFFTSVDDKAWFPYLWNDGTVTATVQDTNFLLQNQRELIWDPIAIDYPGYVRENFYYNYIFNQYDLDKDTNINAYVGNYTGGDTEGRGFFTPRITFRINPLTGLTDILSNFKLYLDPTKTYNTNVYNSAPDIYVITKESVPKKEDESLEVMLGFDNKFNPGKASFHSHRQGQTSNRISDALTGNTSDLMQPGALLNSVYTQEGISYNNVTYYYKLTSESPGNITDFDYFLLTCPGIETRSRWTNTNLSSRSVLAKIPANQFLTTQTRVVDAPQHYVSITNFQTLTLQLIYPDGTPVNILNTGRFSMQLGVWYSDSAAGD